MKFYFYGIVIYPPKNEQEFQKGNLGLHCVEGENEETTRAHYEDIHNKQNLHLVDRWTGRETKAPFRWYGEVKI